MTATTTPRPAGPLTGKEKGLMLLCVGPCVLVAGAGWWVGRPPLSLLACFFLIGLPLGGFLSWSMRRSPGAVQIVNMLTWALVWPSLNHGFLGTTWNTPVSVIVAEFGAYFLGVGVWVAGVIMARRMRPAAGGSLDG